MFTEPNPVRADDQAKITTAVSAALEYLHTASNSSPLADLARESLIRELNRLQTVLARTPRLVDRPRQEVAPLLAFTCPTCGQGVEEPLDAAPWQPPPPIDLATPVPHAWTSTELRQAIDLLPDGIFAGHYFDRVGEKVARQAHVGVSLQRALETAAVIEHFGVNEQGLEDTRGPFLRFRKV